MISDKQPKGFTLLLFPDDKERIRQVKERTGIRHTAEILRYCLKKAVIKEAPE